MVCYNGIKHYARLFGYKTFETIENDFAVYLQSNDGNCVFVKSPWGLLNIRRGYRCSETSIKSCCDLFNSLTKEKAEEYINEYIQQKINELTNSITARTKIIESETKEFKLKIESETKHKEKEQKQLEKFVRYSKEKEK